MAMMDSGVIENQAIWRIVHDPHATPPEQHSQPDQQALAAEEARAAYELQLAWIVEQEVFAYLRGQTYWNKVNRNLDKIFRNFQTR